MNRVLRLMRTRTFFDYIYKNDGGRAYIIKCILYTMYTSGTRGRWVRDKGLLNPVAVEF